MGVAEVGVGGGRRSGPHSNEGGARHKYGAVISCVLVQGWGLGLELGLAMAPPEVKAFTLTPPSNSEYCQAHGL